jgi:hypothetical protein
MKHAAIAWPPALAVCRRHGLGAVGAGRELAHGPGPGAEQQPTPRWTSAWRAIGACARGMGALPATDAGAAGHLFPEPRSAHGAGHRGAQRRGTQPLCGAAGAGGIEARGQDAGLPAGLRRGLAAALSRPAAREHAGREGAGRRQPGLGPAGGLRQGRVPAVRPARAPVAGGRHRLRSLHGRQPPGRRPHPPVGDAGRHRPGRVRARTITLNHDAGRWLSLGLPGDLPAVVREVNGQWQRQATSLARRAGRAALALVLCACTAIAFGQEVPPPAYQLAAQQAGVPSPVLYAVALQESGAGCAAA